MKWLRLWTEWAQDPKITTMPEPMQRRHIVLLCLRRQVDTSTLTDEEIASFMRISMEDLQETKELFTRKKFIDNGWNVLAWDFRNPPSDSGAERQRKYRERKKKKERDVTVTLPLRNGDAREKIREDNIKDYTPKFETIWGLYPRKIEKKLALKKYLTTLNKGADYKDLLKATKNYRKAMAGKEKTHIKHGATFFGPNEPWKEWVDGVPEGFGGEVAQERAESPTKHLECKKCSSYVKSPDWVLNEEGICESCETLPPQ